MHKLYSIILRQSADILRQMYSIKILQMHDAQFQLLFFIGDRTFVFRLKLPDFCLLGNMYNTFCYKSCPIVIYRTGGVVNRSEIYTHSNDIMQAIIILFFYKPYRLCFHRYYTVSANNNSFIDISEIINDSYISIGNKSDPSGKNISILKERNFYFFLL